MWISEIVLLDFSYTEDFPESLVPNIPHSDTANKSTEEEKRLTPKKVSIVSINNFLKMLTVNCICID